MRALKINDFQRGQDPYKSMKIGSHRNIEIGDKFKLTTNLYVLDNDNWTDDAFRQQHGYIKLNKGDIIEVIKIKNWSDHKRVYVNIPNNDYTAINLNIFEQHKEWFKRL